MPLALVRNEASKRGIALGTEPEVVDGEFVAVAAEDAGRGVDEALDRNLFGVVVAAGAGRSAL